MVRIFTVVRDGLVYAQPGVSRFWDLGDIGEFEVHELAVDEELYPAGYVVARGVWHRPSDDGEHVEQLPAQVEYAFFYPEDAPPLDQLRMEHLLQAGWLDWTIEEI